MCQSLGRAQGAFGWEGEANAVSCANAGVRRSLYLHGVSPEEYVTKLRGISGAEVRVSTGPPAHIVDLRPAEAYPQPSRQVGPAVGVRVTARPAEDGTQAQVSCQEAQAYELYRDVVSATHAWGGRDTDLIEVARRLGIDVDDPTFLPLSLDTDTSHYILWLERLLGHEVGWVETRHIGYYCLRLEQDEHEPDLYSIMCQCVGFGRWGQPATRYASVSVELATFHLEALPGGRLQCHVLWQADGGMGAFMQLVSRSLETFGQGRAGSGLLDTYDRWLASWQEEDPTQTLTLFPEDVASDYDGRLEPSQYSSLVQTDLWRYRDWLLDGCGLDTVATDGDPSRVWLREWEEEEVGFAGTTVASDETRDLAHLYPPTEGSTLLGQWVYHGEWASEVEYLRKAVYWAEVRAEEGSEGLIVTATALLPNVERLKRLRVLLADSEKRFGGHNLHIPLHEDGVGNGTAVTTTGGPDRTGGVAGDKVHRQGPKCLTRKRAELFLRIHRDHPSYTQKEVAAAATTHYTGSQAKIGDWKAEYTADDVRNAFRAMGWKW